MGEAVKSADVMLIMLTRVYCEKPEAQEDTYIKSEATMAGMAGGADAAYINEEKFGIRELTRDMDIMVSKMENGQIFRGLMIVNEKANANYNIDFIRRQE